jgi:hypothetical protein
LVVKHHRCTSTSWSSTGRSWTKSAGLIAGKRDATRLGFVLQLVTVRWAGAFLENSDVPASVVDFVAEQLGIVDPSCEEVHRADQDALRPSAGDPVVGGFTCLEQLGKMVLCPDAAGRDRFEQRACSAARSRSG